MSYFVFGFVDFAADENRALEEESDSVKSCASAEGLAIELGDTERQPILREMRGGYSPKSSIPFLLMRSPDADTSDSLISPFAQGIEGSLLGVRTVGRWLRAVFRSPRITSVRIWMTEGYDDAFEEHHLEAERFADVVSGRIAADGDVPSLHVSVSR